MVFHSDGSARRDVGIAPYKVRTDSPEMVRIGDRTARVVEDADPYEITSIKAKTALWLQRGFAWSIKEVSQSSHLGRRE